MHLCPEHCPGIEPKSLDAINALSDQELRLEVENGHRSRFGERLQGALRTALKLREDAHSNKSREEEMELVREANRIAGEALAEAKAANRKADSARLWSAIAVLVTVLLALLSFINKS
jgi:hypothetical protein